MNLPDDIVGQIFFSASGTSALIFRKLKKIQMLVSELYKVVQQQNQGKLLLLLRTQMKGR